MRPDEDAGHDVAQHHRLLQALKQHRHNTGGNHDHGQVLQKTHLMHGVPCRNHAQAQALGQADVQPCGDIPLPATSEGTSQRVLKIAWPSDKKRRLV